MPVPSRALLLLLPLLSLAACDDSVFVTGTTQDTSGGTGGTGGWCAVKSTFNAHCTSCHSPTGGTQGGLDLKTDPYAALVGVASPEYSGRTLVVAGDPSSSFLMAKLTGQQTSSEGSQMPIGAPLSQTTLDAISQWITGGATQACDGTGGGDTSVPECNDAHEDCKPGTCGGEGSHMLPGADCLACHSKGGDREAPIWTIGGTAFTDIYGTDPLDNAKIHIVDATGATIDMTTNSAGNFYTYKAITAPFSASIETSDGTLEMTDHQTYGGCNQCHQCDGEAGGKLYGP